MKKLTAILVLILVIASSYGAAAGYVLPGWTSPELGDDFVSDDGVRRIERVFDDSTQSYMAKIIAPIDGGRNLLHQDINESLINKEHLYSVSFYVRTEVTESNYIYLSCGDIDYRNTYTPNHRAGMTLTFQDVDLSGNPVFSFGLQQVGGTVIYLDNIVIYDQDDETRTNIVINGDFETEPPKLITPVLSENTITWSSDGEIVWDSISVSRSIDGGERVLIAENLDKTATSFEITEKFYGQSVYYITAIDADGNIVSEINCTVPANIVITSPTVTYNNIENKTFESGDFTVRTTVKNIGFEEGFSGSIICQVMDDTNAVVAVFVQNIEVPPGSERTPPVIVKIPVLFTSEEGRLYTVTVHYWDGTETMKIVKKSETIE